MDAVTVRRWELGMYSPSAGKIDKVAEAYGVDVSTLLAAADTEQEYAGTALVPAIGYINAGVRPAGDRPKPGENGPHTISVPSSIVDGRPNLYCLIVSGDSLIPDGIHDGDFILICPDEVPSVGCLCVINVEHCFYVATYILRDQVRVRTTTGHIEDLTGKSIQISGTITWHVRRM